MTSPTFFDRARSLTVREIAALTGAEPRGGADLDRRITGVAALDRALPGDLTFSSTSPNMPISYVPSRAGACLTTRTVCRARRRHSQRACACARPIRRLSRSARSLFGDALRPSSLFDGSRCRDRARSFIRPRGSKAE